MLNRVLSQISKCPVIGICQFSEVFILHILHGFDGETPEYLPRGDREAMKCYVARCRLHSRAFLSPENCRVLTTVKMLK